MAPKAALWAGFLAPTAVLLGHVVFDAVVILAGAGAGWVLVCLVVDALVALLGVPALFLAIFTPHATEDNNDISLPVTAHVCCLAYVTVSAYMVIPLMSLPFSAVLWAKVLAYAAPFVVLAVLFLLFVVYIIVPSTRMVDAACAYACTCGSYEPVPDAA